MGILLAQEVAYHHGSGEYDPSQPPTQPVQVDGNGNVSRWFRLGIVSKGTGRSGDIYQLNL